MNTRCFCMLAIVCALVAVSVAGAEGDDNSKGGHRGPPPGGRDAAVVDFILAHAQDLTITPDQKTKLESLQADIKKQLETLTADPAYQDLQKKMQDARQAKNSDDMKNVGKQIKELTAKNAPSVDQARKLAEAILTPDQVTKLAELLKAARPGPGHNRGGGGGGGNQ